jgi:hypothetical protein
MIRYTGAPCARGQYKATKMPHMSQIECAIGMLTAGMSTKAVAENLMLISLP